MHNGYIKLFRKFEETSFFKNSSCVHLAIYLLLKCNHENKKFIFNGKEISLSRGECITGLNSINSATGMSLQKIRTAKKTLVNIGFLTSKSTNKFSVISIDNYNDYQGDSNRQTNKPVTSKQQASNKPVTTNKNDKNEKNEKKTTLAGEEFNSFWQTYPKKTGKGKALESWLKKKPCLATCLKTISWQKVTNDWTKEGGKYIPMPTTWLNQERWDDEPVASAPVGPSGSKVIVGKYDHKFKKAVRLNG